jgi:2-phospho-L-lactate transferase/gluconeogenesis factor (CofD/UPF0052 family)
VGCTGGKHRSVAMVEQLAGRLAGEGVDVRSCTATWDASEQPAGGPPSDGPRVVALGGGHGLAASLQALRRVTPHVTAVVTVADDGGSSGRLRTELGQLPPGDLRMALAALAGDDDWGRTWTTLLQHRFSGDGPLAGHAVGNLLLAGLTECSGDPVVALELTARLLGAVGRVLPMSAAPLEIAADVVGLDPADPAAVTQVVGQVAVATTPAASSPSTCAAGPARLRRVGAGGAGGRLGRARPGLVVHQRPAAPHGPRAARGAARHDARRLVCLNLAEQVGETDGFTPAAHLDVLLEHAPELALDVVLADEVAVGDPSGLRAAAGRAGARLELAAVALGDGTARHAPDRLAAAYARLLTTPAGPDAPTPRTHPEDDAWR